MSGYELYIIGQRKARRERRNRRLLALCATTLAVVLVHVPSAVWAL